MQTLAHRSGVLGGSAALRRAVQPGKTGQRGRCADRGWQQQIYAYGLVEREAFPSEIAPCARTYRVWTRDRARFDVCTIDMLIRRDDDVASAR